MWVLRRFITFSAYLPFLMSDKTFLQECIKKRCFGFYSFWHKLLAVEQIICLALFGLVFFFFMRCIQALIAACWIESLAEKTFQLKEEWAWPWRAEMKIERKEEERGKACWWELGWGSRAFSPSQTQLKRPGRACCCHSPSDANYQPKTC